MSKTKAPPSVRKWYSTIGKNGVAGRLATLSKEERLAISRAGSDASKKAREDRKKQGSVAGTDTAKAEVSDKLQP